MADILTSTARGIGRTAADTSKMVAAAGMSQAKAITQFYKQVPFFSKVIENTAKDYKKSTQLQTKALSTNTSAINTLNKNLSLFSKNISSKVQYSSGTGASTDERVFNKVEKAAVVGLLTAAFANDKIRGSLIGLTESIYKTTVRTFLGEEKYNELAGGITKEFTNVLKLADGVADGIKEVAKVLKPVADVFLSATKSLGSVLGFETEYGKLIGGAIAGRIAMKGIFWGADKLANRAMAKSGTSAGVGNALNNLSLNAANVYINTKNIANSVGAGQTGPARKGAPGRGRPNFNAGGAGIFGTLSAIALGVGAGSVMGGGFGGDGGDAFDGSSILPGVVGGLGVLALPKLIEMAAQRRMRALPEVKPLYLDTEKKKGFAELSRVEKNMQASQQFKAEKEARRNVLRQNLATEKIAKRAIKVVRSGGVVGVLIEGYSYAMDRKELDEKLEAGEIDQDTYNEAVKKLNYETTGGVVGGVLGAAAAGALAGSIIPGFGTAAGIIGGIAGYYAGRKTGGAIASKPSLGGTSSNIAAIATPKNYSNAAKYAYDYLQRQGLSSADAAAIVGNLIQESGVNPNAYNAKEGAHGIAQWRNERFVALQKFAASQGKPWTDLDVQLDFILHELSTTQKRAWNAMQNATSISDKAAIFDSKYERSNGRDVNKRIGYALGIAGADSGTASAGSNIVPSTPSTRNINEPVDQVEQALAKMMTSPMWKGLTLGQELMPSQTSTIPPQQAGMTEYNPIPSPISTRYAALVAKEQYPFQVGAA
jgi:hypothetical protein